MHILYKYLIYTLLNKYTQLKCQYIYLEMVGQTEPRHADVLLSNHSQ